MLIYRRTSIMESTAQTLVNTVNCVGVMGKGLALEFKRIEPRMFGVYKKLCSEKKLRPGMLWLWRGDGHWVLNFPTKDHWRSPSKLEWIEAGLQKFRDQYRIQGIRDISFPRLGCGNGGLDWEEVRPVMERYLSKLDINVFVHDFEKDLGKPEHQVADGGIVPQLSFTDGKSLTTGAAFNDFVLLLKQGSALTNGDLTDVQDHFRFQAVWSAEEEERLLFITSKGERYSFSEEDLRSLWMAVRSGLVSIQDAGWKFTETGTMMLTLLHRLPNVRLIELKKHNAEMPEPAIQVNRGHSQDLPVVRRQHDLLCP